LKDYGITVAELTGDQQLTKEQIDSTQVFRNYRIYFFYSLARVGHRLHTGKVGHCDSEGQRTALHGSCMKKKTFFFVIHVFYEIFESRGATDYY
jgi:hypothetical protein